MANLSNTVPNNPPSSLNPLKILIAFVIRSIISTRISDIILKGTLNILTTIPKASKVPTNLSPALVVPVTASNNPFNAESTSPIGCHIVLNISPSSAIT